ncbi:nitroreductase family protein [Antrihabitans sp. YC2-6]|uniref:Acg family FMN-binding oxidoreductase n=1 Tax=Antrihabitans sp. YC2-6 TaxID=2799498 RepID=UPI0018F50671|nr:nitroreductase family protein [Antrihabitans sp. YC2-6]MBJ8346989.1 NAD(P)H nitroreductase [Antrihabitans sp. YC2-6]
MDAEFPDEGTIRAAIALALRAPSVHNSQPWRWRMGDRTVHLYIDPKVVLHHTDPDGRDLMLSCGTALNHFKVAMAGLGWRARTHRFPNPADPEHIAAIELDRHVASEQDIAMAGAIPRRRTDRRHYSSWPVPIGHIALMASRAAQEGVVLYRAEALTHLERAVAAAAAEHAKDSDYQTELRVWSGRRGSLDGVPATNTSAPDGTSRMPSRTFANPLLQQPRGVQPSEDAAELLVLATPSDDTISRLRAGEATSAVLLTATSLGLATCPLTEPLELPDTRAAIVSEVLGDSGFPQMILRIGWAPSTAEPLAASPRHGVTEMIDSLDGAVTGRRREVVR